jgi:hypothetical protein
MNKHKAICKSCGVVWVKDDSLPDADNCIVTYIETCESCCPSIDVEEIDL